MWKMSTPLTPGVSTSFDGFQFIFILHYECEFISKTDPPTTFVLWFLSWIFISPVGFGFRFHHFCPLASKKLPLQFDGSRVLTITSDSLFPGNKIVEHSTKGQDK